MTLVDQLLVASGISFVIMMLTGGWRRSGWLAVVLYGLQFMLIVQLAGGSAVPSSLQFTLFGHDLSWQFTGLSWFFGVITLGAALLSTLYAAGEWSDSYRRRGGSLRQLHAALSFNVLSMLILLASNDLLSLFIGWELVSWASYWLMALSGGVAARAALRYITYAMGGAMALLAGIVLVHSISGSLEFSAITGAVPQMSTGQLWTLVVLFGVGFGVKMGLLPFHLWQAAAYAETPGPGAAFLGAISSRMGLFGIALVLIQLIGLTRGVELDILPGYVSATDLLAWIAALTIILPTFTALRQNDARMLLAWHGIGQGGYMLLGLVVSDALGSAGGLMHVFNHATYQAALFMSVFAVIHRTGTSDLNKLGGLVVRMPLSFVTMLVGIIGLAGLPPMNGFVSKWLVYRSLMIEEMPLLFVAAVIGTLGTILSVYKLIHNTFLGQLRVEHEQVAEAPWSMTIPMLVLCVIVFVTGTVPGLVLEWVAHAQAALGVAVIDYTAGGVESASGGLDMIWVVGVLFAGFGVGAVLFYSGGKTRRVHQLDNYAGGHFLTADTRYHYSDNFYAGLMRRIGPWYRNSFQWLESSLVSVIETLAMGMHGLYRQRQPAFALLGLAFLAIGWAIWK